MFSYEFVRTMSTPLQRRAQANASAAGCWLRPGRCTGRRYRSTTAVARPWPLVSSKREQQYVFFARIRILRFFQISKNVTVYVFLK